LLPIACLAATLTAGASPAVDGGDPRGDPSPIHVQAKGPSTIPFDAPSGLVIVTARINGRSHVRLLLDTGDPSGFTLDTKTARAIGLPLRERTPTRATGVVGSERYTLYRAQVGSFLLGGLSASDFSIWTAPDAVLIAKTTGVRVDGFIGVDLLRDLRVTIDYPARQITFAPASPPPASPPSPAPQAADGPAAVGAPRDRVEVTPQTLDGAPLPMRLEGNRIVLEALLNGAARRAVILDTAAGASFISQTDLNLTEPSPTGRAAQIVDSSGTAVSVPIRILPRIQIGAAFAERVAVVPLDFDSLNRDLFAATPLDIAGILGGDLLSRFVVILDFPNRTVSMRAGER